MSAPRLVYQNTVDALVERMLIKGKRMTPRLQARLTELGVNREANAGLSQEAWRQVLPAVAAELFPGLPPEEGHHKLGGLMLTSFTETIVGKALFATLRVIGVRRGLERMTKNFQLGNNFTEAKLTPLADKDVELWVSDVNTVPGYIRGLLEAACSLAGGKEVIVDLKAFEDPSATYRIRWK